MTDALASPDAREVLEALPIPVATFDATARFTGLNEAAELWLNLSTRGVAGLRTDNPSLFARLRVEPELGPLVAQAASVGEAVHPCVRFQIGDRAGGWTARRAGLHLTALPGGGVVALIRPEPEAENVLPRRAARSAIGMAEMLAHEIKNPLAGIRGAAQLLSEGLGPEDRELTDLIVAESRRIVALLEEVERFGDTSRPQLQPVNIHDILDRARRSMALGGTAPRIVTDYDPSLPPALVDPSRIMQVVLNLLRNAAEALAREAPAADGGPALIRLRTAFDGESRTPEGAHLGLRVEVEDNGPGIPEAIADQIFEPFVSGRENGTGLGLALVSKIVTEHGGLVRVDSRPGRTLFRLSLPLAGKGDP
ncbi:MULTISPECIES: nitrogen regulation protein NR(II) [unclassified Paracoccus (in: a-proteobacteria)]|uniref:two-component system sensor histidine kinase NtrB n=1 Tax=unclassified Paracoccus (in: a-proteobacteria) TaxID=2688777 RepID=UPI0015FF44D7|nr:MULTISPECIES: ATP-binding protein [unclassified Paracoccus (in: a-proteobacteria)]MBB1490133.1 PAS domain-containing sensor histidine kinase [Paracoccus sp. MC1854]MBB1496721.1 PAS domain-containing sensor histidine kinase [Paracoccus sp. MC1862]QQO43728.1 PAS domain-containing sensor histidine kinase [Paracoccus sp. MC1862]